MDLIAYMNDYRDLLKDHSAHLVELSQKWQSKLKEQSALASYNTTKRAQRQTITTSDTHAQVVDARCEAIANLIKELRKEVDQFYPSRGIGKTPKHNRADALKGEFQRARAPVNDAEEKLEGLQSKEKEAIEALRKAEIAYEEIQYGAPTSEKKSDRAKKKQEEKKQDLESIRKRIRDTQVELDKAKILYREQAKLIFEKCQKIEQKRLDLIRSTLIKFLQTVHPDSYSSKIESIYTEVRSMIETQQNTEADLNFWARTYGAQCPSSTTTESANTVTETAVSVTPKPKETSTDSTTTSAEE